MLIARKPEKSVRRGMLCVGCGVCVGKCPQNAIAKESHKIISKRELQRLRRMHRHLPAH